jgi:MFS family permease
MQTTEPVTLSTSPSPSSGRPPPVKGAAFAFAMIYLLSGVDALESRIITGIFPFIQPAWHLSKTDLQILGYVPLVALVVGGIPVAFLADRFDRTRIVALGGIAGFVATCLTFFARSFPALLWLTALTGIGDASYQAPMLSMGSDYVRPARRDLVLLWIQVVSIIGAAMGAWLTGILAQALGWPAVFPTVGVLGIITALVFLRVREPGRRNYTPQTIGVLRAGWRSVHHFFAVPSVRLSVLGLGIIVATTASLGDFFPLYLISAFHISAPAADGDLGLLLLLAGLGVLLGGAIDTWLYTRWNRNAPLQDIRSRPLIAGISAFLGAAVFLAGLLGSLSLSATLFCAALAALMLGMSYVPLQSVLADLVPGESLTTAYTFQNIFYILVGSFFAIGLGLVSDALHLGYGTTLAIASLPALLAGIGFMALVRRFRRDRQLFDYSRERSFS